MVIVFDFLQRVFTVSCLRCFFGLAIDVDEDVELRGFGGCEEDDAVALTGKQLPN